MPATPTATASSRNRISSPAARAASTNVPEVTSEENAAANFSTPMGAESFFPAFAVLFSPAICQVLAFISVDARLSSPTLSGFALFCSEHGWQRCMQVSITASSPLNLRAWMFFGSFMVLARLLNEVPAAVKCGPLTGTGHVPRYIDNAMQHCILSSLFFIGGSNFFLDLYDFGIIYDVFLPLVGTLNLFGLAFCFFLYVKGLKFPSTKDSGSSGSFLLDYYWGTELYPKVLGADVKRMINCRFSMTFWMLSGLSYAYRSYTTHHLIDYGLLLSAVSQYIYLVKFFAWEMGYMGSTDIIVDRAGFYEEWGCLVFVPTLYTLHTRLLVRSPSQLNMASALPVFLIGLAGVLLNFWADKQREWFRDADGKCKIWGKAPVFFTGYYTVVDNDKKVTKSSLLLASGFWGVARHFHYVFELTAAWSWCLLANPFVNGFLPLSYAIFLTILLFDRAKRDEQKCTKKYGKAYKDYSEIVPYLIIPGIY